MTRWMAVAALGIWLLGLGPSVGEAQTRRRQPADATKSETAAKPTAPKVAAAPPAPAPKRSANPAQPVDVEADRLESNQKEGLVIFTGNVVARHNNSTQYADRMEVYLDDGGDRVLRTVSTGTCGSSRSNCRTGTAQRVEYYDAEQRSSSSATRACGRTRTW